MAMRCRTGTVTSCTAGAVPQPGHALLRCLLGGLVEDCGGSCENAAHFVGIDDTLLEEQLLFQTHQPSRYLVFDRKGQFDVQVVTHTIQSQNLEFVPIIQSRMAFPQTDSETDGL